MLYNKNQPQSLLTSGEEDFLSVLPYMGMARNNLKKIVNILLTEGPCETL